MKPRRVLAPRDTSEIFSRAVQERALAVLTLQEDDQWITFKSRFLERDPGGRFFVLEHQSNHDDPLPDLSPGQYIGVTFRQRSRKLLFATVVEARGQFVLDDRTSVPAIRYRWPETMTELQRRAYYRTPVPDGTSLTVNVWSGGVAARAKAQQESLAILTGDLADLSCGGALIRLQNAATPPWVDEETLGLEMHLPDGRAPVMVDARYRGVRHDDSGTLGAAVQFVGLELNVDGRVLLQRLANSVQRLHRMGLASGKRDWDSKFKA